MFNSSKSISIGSNTGSGLVVTFTLAGSDATPPETVLTHTLVVLNINIGIDY